MKEEALHLVASVSHPARKLNLLREYLQAFTLRSFHESEAFTSIAFVGGTALRFLHGVPRFSEDLDFSVVGTGPYAPTQWLSKLKRDLTLSGFDCSISWKSKNPVNVAFLRVGDLLHPAGLGSRREQKLSIKLEFDTNPPAGAVLERNVITRHLTFALCHFSLPSLLSGKLHALTSRGYPKGRDWFDLVWYAGRRPALSPNLILLQNAYDQSHGPGVMDATLWCTYLARTLDSLDPVQLAADVHPFLERPEDRLLMEPSTLRSALAALASSPSGHPIREGRNH